MKASTVILALVGVNLSNALPSPGQSDANEGNLLLPRKENCAVRAYGCEDKYCWKKCNNSGGWCWLTYNNGAGDWVGCTSDANCQNRKDAACANAGRDHGGCGC